MVLATCVRMYIVVGGTGTGDSAAVQLLADAREGEDDAHYDDESGEGNEEKWHGGRHVEVVFDIVEVFHKNLFYALI